MQQSASSLRTTRQLQTLVVEPETEARQLLELALSVRGHAVTACQDAASARAELRLESFPLIVVSRFLPDGDALQLVRELRGNSDSAHSTIVIISNTPTTEDHAELLAAGANDYIPWPADMDMLRERFDIAERQAFNQLNSPSRAASPAELFLVLNPDGTIRQATALAGQFLGFPPDALTGVNGFSFFDPVDTPTLLGVIVESFTRPDGATPRGLRLRRDSDTWRTLTLSARAALDDPALGGIAFYLHGPETRLDTGDAAARATLHDPVTDLPNHTLFLDRIDHAVARAARKTLPVVVVTVDFNEFAGVSEVSDGLIGALAQRLRSCLRTSDTAARLGHDEFGLLLEEIVDLGNVRIVAERVIESMQVPFYEGGAELTLTPNIGIVVSSTERYRAVDLLRDSNTARNWARVEGAGRYVVFEESMGTPTREVESSGAPPAAPVAAQSSVSTSVSPSSEVEPVEPQCPANAETVDTRFDTLQERLDTLEQLIQDLHRS